MNRLPPGRQQPRQQAPSTQGVLHRVPCPHCGRPNDFRELDGQQLLDTGHKVTCRGENQGEGCGQLMEVVAVQTVKLVAVKPIRGYAPPQQQPARDARTISPAQLQRMLKS